MIQRLRRFAVRRGVLLLATMILCGPAGHAGQLPAFGESSLLSEANVLRMEPPFETRYYFTFRSSSGGSATVIFDLYYDKGKHDEARNRVLIDKGDGKEALVPPSDYRDLSRRLPESLMLAKGASIGISLQECVSTYARLLFRLKNPWRAIDPPERSPREKVGGLYRFGRMIRLHPRSS